MLFDELQNFTGLCLSWFCEYSNGIYQALRKRSSSVQLADGKEVKFFVSLYKLVKKRIKITVL